MAEYIEREALMKNFCGYDLTKCVKYGNKDAGQQHDSYSTMMMYEIADEIIDAPAADVAPVVHGRWVDRYGGKYANPLYECSECKRRAPYKFENDSLNIGLWVQDLTDYCPNCGARMDGERKSDG